MELFLQSPPNELVEKFFSLKKREDVADLLEIPYHVLIFHTYRVLSIYKYTIFSIPKRSGGERKICAPITRLKILQRKLAFILKNVYKTKPCVCGFVDGGSILKNAKNHTCKVNLLNIDLTDFFPSINFGRVRGMFMAKPYNIPPRVATILAQICCFNNELPQGAPTSPIVSNMICGKMDSELNRFAKRNKCAYSRYADDITISTNRSLFPKSVAQRGDSPRTAILGENLIQIIKQNGFDINPKKVSLRSRSMRQEVTGLTVNQFPNVNRKFTNRLRAMLHAWEKYGLENAEREFLKEYDKKHRSPFLKDYWSDSKTPSLFRKVIIGNLNFLSMVRGYKDPVFLKFCTQLVHLDPTFEPAYKTIIQKSKINEFEDSVFVLDKTNFEGITIGQSSAFMLAGVGIVSCEHVLGEYMEISKVYKPLNRITVDVQIRDHNRDIAIFNLPQDFSCIPLKKGNSARVKIGDDIKVVGFPNYAHGATIQIFEGKITGSKKWHGNDRLMVDSPIMYGNSGGPVLNDKNEVIGIAATGKDKPETYSREVEFGVIPINAIDELVNK